MTVRTGVVSLILYNRESAAPKVNEILYRNADIIVGRMGIPNPEKGVFMISVMVEGDEKRVERMVEELKEVNSVQVGKLFVK